MLGIAKDVCLGCMIDPGGIIVVNQNCFTFLVHCKVYRNYILNLLCVRTL